MSRGTIGGQRPPAPAALRGRIVYGSYQGDDAETRMINLGFQPDIVLLVKADGSMGYQSYGFSIHYGGLSVSGSPANYASGKDSAKDYITCTANGFLVKSFTQSDVAVNESSSVYNYVAIKTGG